MGVIALALITTGHLSGDVKNDGLPFWIIASCALAIGLGTYIGGWRVIRTLGKGLVEIESPQGLAAEASSAAIILSSSAAVWPCPPPTWRPVRSWAAASASPEPRCAGR
nr:inorganic phosphate transporter [Streptomyces sp. DSM 41633]